MSTSKDVPSHPLVYPPQQPAGFVVARCHLCVPSAVAHERAAQPCDSFLLVQLLQVYPDLLLHGMFPPSVSSNENVDPMSRLRDGALRAGGSEKTPAFGVFEM